MPLSRGPQGAQSDEGDPYTAVEEEVPAVGSGVAVLRPSIVGVLLGCGLPLSELRRDAARRVRGQRADPLSHPAAVPPQWPRRVCNNQRGWSRPGAPTVQRGHQREAVLTSGVLHGPRLTQWNSLLPLPTLLPLARCPSLQMPVPSDLRVAVAVARFHREKAPRPRGKHPDSVPLGARERARGQPGPWVALRPRHPGTTIA